MGNDQGKDGGILVSLSNGQKWEASNGADSYPQF